MLDCIGNNTIDTRDLIKEWEELDSDHQTLLDEIEELKESIADSEGDEDATEEEVKELTDKLDKLEEDLEEWEEAEDYEKMKDFLEECESYCSDFKYGEVLIEESYFEEYAEELAGDIGAIDSNASWPLNHIDWEAAADELKSDYTTIEIDGYTYYTR